MKAQDQRAIIKQVKSNPELVEAFHMPWLAWPTVMVLVLSFAGFAASTYALLTDLLPPLVTIVLSGFFIFWSFTPLHEAVHRNLSRVNWLNDLIGTVSAQLLLPGFTSSLYRFLHVTHHARTGQDDDPDLKFTKGSLFSCLLNAAFLDILWVRYYISVWTERPLGERARFSLGLVLYLTLFAVGFSSAYVVEFTLAFILPMFVGRILTVYLFATIQHRPGHEQRVDPVGATSIQDVHSHWWRHLFMLGQSQHLVHHLYPGVPWYKYDPIWKKVKEFVPSEQIRQSGYFSRNQEPFGTASRD